MFLSAAERVRVGGTCLAALALSACQPAVAADPQTGSGSLSVATDTP